MEPKQAWGAFSLVFIVADVLVGVMIDWLGYSHLLALLVAIVAMITYLYVVYKRYHVEVVPESDIVLFDDPDDLRILSRIYGLEDSGNIQALRQRLVAFARKNKDNAFVWVAPKHVVKLGSALEMPQAASSIPQVPLGKKMIAGTLQASTLKTLPGGRSRSVTRRTRMRECPVCDAKVAGKGSICEACGADLEFYSVLRQSRVGKRLLAQKSGAVRRKLRYEVPTLGAK